MYLTVFDVYTERGGLALVIHVNVVTTNNYYTTKAVQGPITEINQSDYFISGPVRADIFPVSDRVLSRMIPRDSAQDFCLLNQDGGKYEQYFS